MNSSNTPPRIVKAFGVNGDKNTIPTESNPSTDSNGVATFNRGFPPITMQPLSAGGIPPSGMDMNGVLYSVTLQQQWYNAGMTYPFNQDFSDAINGYPKGAIVPSSPKTGQWLNLNEGNTTQPESPNGQTTGWVPINNYGISQISITSNSVVMSSLQAAKDRIILSGTLTSNVNLIFPAWIKSWVVHNNCTGNFNITCKTSAGNGVIVIPGLVSRIFCDGVNISDETYNPNNDMVGMIASFIMNSAPEGWLVADGSPVSRTTYARLFSRIGTLYGSGNGSTTFNLPDMRGEFIRGFDAGRGVDAGRVFGSWQKGSVIVGDDGVGTVTVASSNVADKRALGLDLGGSETYQISTVNGESQARGNQYFGYSRPRNNSFLFCVKY